MGRRVDSSLVQVTRGEDLREPVEDAVLGPTSCQSPPPAHRGSCYLSSSRGVVADSGQHCAFRVPRVGGATARATLAA